MSDEGIMTDEIQDCLMVVIKAVKKSNLATKTVVRWCEEMLAKDRVGFLCNDELKTLWQKQ